METNSPSIPIGYDDFIVTICHSNFNNTIVFTNSYGVDTILARTGILFKQGLFNHTFPCAEQHIMAIDKFSVFQTFHTKVGSYIIIRINVQQVLNGTSFRVFRTFRNLVYFQPITFSLLSKKHHSVVHCSRINMLNKILVTGFSSF